MSDKVKLLVILGEFDEVILDAEQIHSIVGIAKVDRAGNPVTPPEWVGSAVRVAGHEHLVPQEPNAVVGRMHEAYQG